MEYRMCNLHATDRLSSDPQIASRPAILPPRLPQILSRTGLSLNSFYHLSDYKAYYEAHVLRRSSSSSWNVNSNVAKNEMSNSLDTMKKSKDNEASMDDERDGEDEEEEIKIESSVSEKSNNNDSEDPENESGGGGDDSKSTNNSYPSRDYISSTKPLTPFSYFGLDKHDSMTSSLLSGWVLGAYTAMLGTLSTATTPFETIQVQPTTQSDSESESGHSSYTEKSTENNSMVGIHKNYSCGLCNISNVTRCALRKHMLNCHRAQATVSPGMSDLLTTITNNSRCQVKTHVGTCHHHHSMVAKQEASSSKKRALTLQRVRYEREEYKCTECSYACTIEKAFQRHLRAHAKGTLAATATETRVSCAVCGADRSSEVDLSRHMRRHRDDRYFCCDICVFRTVQLKKLIQHRRMHTGEKPHLCPHCAYRSARRDNLRSHVRRVHKKENLYCDTFSPQGCMMIGPSLQEASSITSESSTITAATTHVQHPNSPSSSTSHVVQ